MGWVNSGSLGNSHRPGPLPLRLSVSVSLPFNTPVTTWLARAYNMALGVAFKQTGLLSDISGLI